MGHPEGAGLLRANRVDFDPRVRLEFHGTQLSSDGGLLVMRELDDALGFGAQSNDMGGTLVRSIGLVRAKARIGGRPPALTAAQKREVQHMRDEEGRALLEIASLFKVSTRTVRRA